MSTWFCYCYFFHFCICQYYYMHFVHYLLVTIDVVYTNTVRFKHTDPSWHFLELNCRGYLNFLKLKQLFIDSDITSNSEPMQNDCRSPPGCWKKIKVFKEQQKKCDLNESKVNVASYSKIQNCFSIQFNQSEQTSLSRGQLLALAF